MALRIVASALTFSQITTYHARFAARCFSASFMNSHDARCGVLVSGSNESSPGNDSHDSRRRILSAIFCPSFIACLGLICQSGSRCNSSLFANDTQPPATQIQIGWNGAYLVGRWTQVAVDVEVPVAGDYQVHVTAPDPDGHLVTFSSPAKALQPGRQQVQGYFRVGRMDPEIEIRVAAASSTETICQWSSSDLANPRLAPLTPAVRLIVTIGNPTGFDWESSASGAANGSNASTGANSSAGAAVSEFRTIATTVDKLPSDAVAYDGVSLLVLAGQSVLSTDQSAALRDWVAGGGRLVISLPADLKFMQRLVQPLKSWLPMAIGDGEVTVRNFGKLEFFSGKNVRIPFTGRMSIPSIRIDQGEYLAGGRDEALLVRSPYGLGSVTALALDLTEPPLSQWTEVASLGRRLAESSSEGDTTATRPAKSLQLSSIGVSDFATQIHAVQEDFADVTRASPWLVMGLLGVLLLVIGPVDYVIVHRVLKRPRGTWITFPIWIALGTVLSANLAMTWNGRTQRINQLNLVNVDVVSSTCHQKLWTNVYSPEMVRKSVSIDSVIAGAPNPPNDVIHSSWSGVPETSFGGMVRPTGLDVGRADYHQSLDGHFEGIPFVQWSSKPLLTEIHSHVDRLVESDLKSDGAGRLSGTLIHRFKSPIEDWFLVYGNRVYRQMKQRDDSATLPLAPSQRWRVEQPNVFQRELRAFLTGEVAMSKKREGAQFSDVVQRHADYNPLSRDPAVILRTLSFYHLAGGRAYTSLTNNVLESEDLSHLLKLGRAVLFGRLNVSTAVVQVDGQTVQPNQESTFVRLVLPVRKTSSDVQRELERLGQ